MARVTLERREVWQVIEIGTRPPGGEVDHGTYVDERGAWQRHDQLLRDDPTLRTPGVLQVRARIVETIVEPPTTELRRDHADKAIGR